jgi:hypothetical protein
MPITLTYAADSVSLGTRSTVGSSLGSALLSHVAGAVLAGGAGAAIVRKPHHLEHRDGNDRDLIGVNWNEWV